MSRESLPSAEDPTLHDEVGIEELLREVGARDEPGADTTQAVYAAVHAEWCAVVQRRERRRRSVAVALAAGLAGVAAATTLALRILQPELPSQLVATIVRIEGHPQIEVSGRLHEAQPGEALSTGMRLQTADGRVALSCGASNALSLRVDAGSELRFSQPGVIELQAGAVYVDSGADPASTPLVVQTAAGAVRHLGTQYQIRTVGGNRPGIEVGIREGRVEIASGYGTNTGVAGELVAVSTAGTILRSALPPYDVSWQWAAQIAPPYDIAGRSLSSFLEWQARETGRELSYESAATQRAAAALELGGSIAGLKPDQALIGVLSGTKFKTVGSTERSLRITLTRD